MKRTPLELEKLVMLERISKKFAQLKASRPIVDTGLGFSVQGGYQDLQNLESARDLGMTYVRASDNQSHSVTPEQWETVITTVKANAAQRFQRKWNIESEIKAAPDLNTLRAIDTTF